MGDMPRKGNRNMKTKKTNGNHMMKRILALGLCLLLAAGCSRVMWQFPEETGFYQPIVIARK